MPASSEVTAALAELSIEDRAADEKQRTCPVTDAALGSMGKPFKISVKGRDVFLCCEMCKDAVTGDPEKYLAKLPD
jgi:Cu(I)/Ag(I) efflux system membrane fusion protein